MGATFREIHDCHSANLAPSLQHQAFSTRASSFLAIWEATMASEGPSVAWTLCSRPLAILHREALLGPKQGIAWSLQRSSTTGESSRHNEVRIESSALVRRSPPCPNETWTFSYHSWKNQQSTNSNSKIQIFLFWGPRPYIPAHPRVLED